MSSSAPGELPQLVRRGTGAVLAAQVGSQLVSLVSLACLARLVDAESFGVIGLAFPLVMLPRTAAAYGFGAAAIQDAQGHDELLSGLFWRGLVWSIAAAGFTGLLGGLIGWQLEVPELIAVTVAMGLGTVIHSLSGIHLAVLERRLQLRAAALIRLTAQTLAAIGAVWSASRGAGLWALVGQHVGELVLLAPLSWLLSSWRPGLRHTKLSWETQRFGGYFALSGLLLFASHNVDKLLLAAWLGTSERGQALLGMYSQAYNLMIRPVYFVTTPMYNVMLATLSRVRGEEPTELAPPEFCDWTERFYQLTALLLLPAGIGLWVVSTDVMGVLAPEWPEAGTILTLLAPMILAQGFLNIAGTLLAARQRSGLLCLAAAAQLVLLCLGVWSGASFAENDYRFNALEPNLEESLTHQTYGAAVGATAITLAMLLPLLSTVFWVAGVPIVRFFRALRYLLPAAVMMGVLVYLLRRSLIVGDVEVQWRLVLCVAVGAVAYGAITYPIWRRALRPH